MRTIKAILAIIEASARLMGATASKTIPDDFRELKSKEK
jgi:hypothetical protein